MFSPPQPSLQDFQVTHVTTNPISPLKYQRLLRGWSQNDLAVEIYRRCVLEGNVSVGITSESVRRWECGIHQPSPVYRKHICAIFALNAVQLGFLDPYISNRHIYTDISTNSAACQGELHISSQNLL
ncbi:helix-turn-helix domain-containing protein [Dictyobacter arantiisoli]|uniref:HTH cro/C1-type domain-containing protein n=1 Tax=Dictyobacter arantiisoli TaxID=2014874 RepID=A0A5A5THU0_9CHLR|nr:helix-turn-helix transcriptional regulator [Dictyobacter arantiisoli]GCF10795.1 hypothetical protein KDI_43590 [Dictyobacter arantiisoli]